MKLKYRYVIPLRSITKKNHQQLVKVNGRMIPVQSKAYKEFSKKAMAYIDLCVRPDKPIDYPINLKVWYIMPKNKDGTVPKKKLDLINLLQGTQDLLVDGGILEDDNVNIVSSVDGSKVIFGDCEPITIIEIYEVVNEEMYCRDGAENRAEGDDVAGSTA